MNKKHFLGSVLMVLTLALASCSGSSADSEISSVSDSVASDVSVSPSDTDTVSDSVVSDSSVSPSDTDPVSDSVVSDGVSPEESDSSDSVSAEVFYKTTFYNYDGSLLYTGSVSEGQDAVYGGETPTKKSDSQFSYTFTGWDRSLENIMADTAFTAQYSNSLNTYTVSFVNYDFSVLQSDTYEYGVLPLYAGETPVKDDDEQYEYTFSGWSPMIAEVTGNATYVAQYSSETKQYKVTFVNTYGEVLQKSMMDYGQIPEYVGETPTYEEVGHTFEFNGWSPNISEVVGDVTYVAQFARNINKVRFFFHNDSYSFAGAASDVAFLYIPETWDDGIHGSHPVTSISNYAGNNLDNLQKLYIPDTVTSIGYNAFGYCDNLCELRLPNGLEYVGHSAFENDTHILFTLYKNGKYFGSEENPYMFFAGAYDLSASSFTLSSKTEYIIYKAFYNMPNLLEIDMPESVVSIDYGCIMDCDALVKISFSGTEIPQDLFSKTDFNNVRTMIFKEGVKKIGRNAFEFDGYYGTLDYLSLPNSLEYIGISAFIGLEIKELSFGDDSHLKTVCSFALENVTDENLILPDTLETIGPNNFKGYIKNISIPDGLKAVKAGSLPDILPEAMIEKDGSYYIGNENNPYLVYCGSVNPTSTINIQPETKMLRCGLDQEVLVIPEGITTIFPKVMQNYTSITSLTLPSTLKTICDYAFRGCTSLTSVTLLEGLDYIGTYAFADCTSLSSVSMPDSIIYVEQNVFYNCNALSFNNDGGLTYLGNDENPYALLVYVGGNTPLELKPNSQTKAIALNPFLSDNTNQYTSVDLSDLPATTFYSGQLSGRCSSGTIYLPKSLVVVEDYASSLSCDEIVVPTSVKKIGYWGLDQATKIIYEGTIEQFLEIELGADAFVSSQNNIISCTNGELLTKDVVGLR
ncbi:MAG: leucine-rich repeat domain-containing protein [Bacilli bacterium]